MRYIRTKGGSIVDTKDMHPETLKWYQDVHLLKEANTIEELCDLFVKKSNEPNNDYFKIGKDAFEVLDRKYHKEDLEHYDYYGAIWTDRGILYVAKMNNKGELELL